MVHYSRVQLLSLCFWWKVSSSVTFGPTTTRTVTKLCKPVPDDTWKRLKELDILKPLRGKGSHRNSHNSYPSVLKNFEQPLNDNLSRRKPNFSSLINIQTQDIPEINNSIPTLVTNDRRQYNLASNLQSCANNLITIQLINTGPTPSKITPKILVVNARSLAKTDATPALHAELHSNNIDICIISETWLNNNIASSLVCPDGYVIVRKDRSDHRMGGGVAVLCRNNWMIKPIKSLNCTDNGLLECLWCLVKTTNSKFYVSAVYHPPNPLYHEVILLDELSESCEKILQSTPDANIVIAGDVNQLNYRDFKSQHNLVQMVKQPTRGDRILDVFLTNKPHLWKSSTTVFKGLLRSDHMAVVISPQVPSKPVRRVVFTRDTREHRKIQMVQELEKMDWSAYQDISALNDVNDMAREFTNNLIMMYDKCFPVIKVKMSSRDPPFMSPLVKHLCRKRNRCMRKRGFHNDNLLQERINQLIRENQVREVQKKAFEHGCGAKKWWDTVNRITGRNSTNQVISSIIDPESINSYFKEINTDPNYTKPETLLIPERTPIPSFDITIVEQFLSKQDRTAVGPDQLPYWLWRDFSHHLAPIVTRIFNLSIAQQIVPLAWKTANVRPIPKESPVSESNQLRPISLTNIIMRLFERLVFKQEMSTEFKSIIGKDQFAFKEGCNTTLALLKSQHFCLSALDGDCDYVRLLSFDFSKAFDSVSHKVISEKLKSTLLNPYIINWTINFLSNRKQRVVVDSVTTAFADINRGVPQGTVLGPVLFSLMVNDIEAANPRKNLLVKFADDITISVPVHRGVDTAPAEVTKMKDWANSNSMTLSLPKTWEMCIHRKTSKPAPMEIQGIKRKSWLKLLGVTFQEDPTNWDIHVDNMLSKASGRMYLLRVCKSYGYPKDQLNKLFQSLIMSIFLYAIEVWGAAYQRKYRDRINVFLKRAYRFGYSTKLFNIDEVVHERDSKLFKKIQSEDHVLNELLPQKRNRKLRERSHNYILPLVKTERFKNSFLNRCLFG